jgi:hypothetical protein
MKSKFFGLVVIVIGWAILPVSANASTLDFTFSFTNDSGDVNGTVTGEIIGLADNATSSASAIYITSYPASLGLSLTTPYSLTPLPSSTLNKFRVFNGEVVESGFLYEIGSLALVLDNSEALLENAGSGFFVRSGNLEIEPTPLPAALPLFATGLGALGLFGWRRKRKDAAALAAT